MLASKGLFELSDYEILLEPEYMHVTLIRFFTLCCCSDLGTRCPMQN